LQASDGVATSSEELEFAVQSRAISVSAGPAVNLIDFDLRRVGGRAGHEGSFEIQGNPLVSETLSARARFDREVQAPRIRVVDARDAILANIPLTTLPGAGADSFEYWGEIVVPLTPFSVSVIATDNGTDFLFPWPETFVPQSIRISLDLTPSAYLAPGSSGNLLVTFSGPGAEGDFDVYVDGDEITFPAGNTFALFGVTSGSRALQIPFLVPSDAEQMSAHGIQVVCISRANQRLSNHAETVINIETGE
jgi:hypothetical protein